MGKQLALVVQKSVQLVKGTKICTHLHKCCKKFRKSRDNPSSKKSTSSDPSEEKMLGFKDPNKPYKIQPEEMDTDIPVSAGIGLAVIWTITCGIYFMTVEGWTFFESIYFTFITTTTTGFGDLSPTNFKMTIFSFAFIFIGLALLAMVINIIQINMHNLLRRVEVEIHQIQSAGTNETELSQKPPEEMVEELFLKHGSRFLAACVTDEKRHIIVGEYIKATAMISAETQTDMPDEVYFIPSNALYYCEKEDLGTQTTGEHETADSAFQSPWNSSLSLEVPKMQLSKLLRSPARKYLYSNAKNGATSPLVMPSEKITASTAVA